MSEFSTKNGSVLFSRIFFAKAIGPAVPNGSLSCENVKITPNLSASSSAIIK